MESPNSEITAEGWKQVRHLHDLLRNIAHGIDSLADRHITVYPRRVTCNASTLREAFPHAAGEAGRVECFLEAGSGGKRRHENEGYLTRIRRLMVRGTVEMGEQMMERRRVDVEEGKETELFGSLGLRERRRVKKEEKNEKEG
ncbi:unnamed protein product [Clonostachys rosea f. rosea IK726]|uniref:Uncharacterized protein n=1 Tax=Clonostachys rosea f. rosea IK726 TaxID=1349383 RepID=A0ACA9TDG0_BIOOC|nr:unnamed protein product [Clonostachys rosea f. rosea IK726]